MWLRDEIKKYASEHSLKNVVSNIHLSSIRSGAADAVVAFDEIWAAEKEAADFMTKCPTAHK